MIGLHDLGTRAASMLMLKLDTSDTLRASHREELFPWERSHGDDVIACWFNAKRFLHEPKKEKPRRDLCRNPTIRQCQIGIRSNGLNIESLFCF